ncbi:hypothetical protein L915_07440 [Phytophthora nicotianae]|uniref:Uncharacterized protein n=1 Tax=Phytophthora nicotianae TaxID=4792 RepID=W2GZ49_PHYNI|nr:hypothetical protein L915_07440 [Phytophthora nicotianae]
MANYVHGKTTHRELQRLTGDQMQSRWRTYIKKFWGTLYDSIHRAGLGLTKRDVANGITLIEQKLEARCPEFLRIKVLFSEMSNIKPAGTVDLVSPLGPLS